MTKPLVFISHSTSKSGPDGRPTLANRVKDELHRLLEHDYEVWLDRADLVAGDHFAEEISIALLKCSAVVVLIDGAALASTWVQRESWVVNTRRKAFRTAVVVPVLFPGISAEDVRDFAVEDLHFVRPDDGDLAAAESIVGKVKAAIATIPAPRPPAEMDDWIDLVAGHLAHLHHDRLPDVVAALELTETQRRQVLGQLGSHRVLAYYLVTRSDGARLVEAMSRLRFGMERSRLQDLVKWLRPTWVDEKQADQLLTVGAVARSRRVELGAGEVWVGVDYARRASRFRYGYVVDRAPVAAVAEAPVDELLLAFKQALDRRARSATDPLRLDRNLKRVLVVPIWGVPLHRARQAVRRLHQDHPEVTVLLLTDENHASAPDGEGVVLRPLPVDEVAGAEQFIVGLTLAAGFDHPYGED